MSVNYNEKVLQHMVTYAFEIFNPGRWSVSHYVTLIYPLDSSQMACQVKNTGSF
jgi:hypothetical protein